MKKEIKIKKRISNKKSKLFIILPLVLIIISLIIVASYFILINVNGEGKYLKIKLNGEKEIKVEYGSDYEDLGATAKYKKKDISKNITVKNNLNLEKIGNYTYTYTIKYKNQEKKIVRKVSVIDTEKPVIKLNGNSEMTLYVGSEYKEAGYEAVDNYDLDLHDKVEIIGTVDINKVGEYIIVYKVKDSSDNEFSIDRKVKVIEKPVVNTSNNSGQKIAVLNYHFFYETDEENEVLCDKQSICEKMDTFREQLKWLNDNGYKTLTINEFVDWMYGNIEIPEKSVLITIDDGGLGTGKHNKNYLIPALEEYKIHATLFLITGWWDIENYRSEYLDIESHTHELHVSGGCNATCVGHDKLVEDLNKSINVTKSKEAFCFPFYQYNDEAIRAVKDVGFKVAFIGGNRKASRSDDKYKIPRYVIYDSTSLQQFINMVR